MDDDEDVISEDEDDAFLCSLFELLLPLVLARLASGSLLSDLQLSLLELSLLDIAPLGLSSLVSDLDTAAVLVVELLSSSFRLTPELELEGAVTLSLGVTLSLVTLSLVTLVTLSLLVEWVSLATGVAGPDDAKLGGNLLSGVCGVEGVDDE